MSKLLTLLCFFFGIQGRAGDTVIDLQQPEINGNNIYYFKEPSTKGLIDTSTISEVTDRPPSPSLSCRATSVQDSGVSGRARRIVFPDGRFFNIIGHDHGPRDFPLELSRISRMSQEEKNDYFHWSIKINLNHTKALQHARSDFSYLMEFLSSGSPLHFIGIELADSEIRETRKWLEELRDRILSQVRRRGLPNSPLYQDSLLLAMGAVNLLAAEQPDLFKDIKVKGFEDENKVKEHEHAKQKKVLVGNSLVSIIHSNREFYRQVKKTVDQMDLIYPSYDPNAHDKKISEDIEKNTPPVYQSAVRKWTLAALAEMKALKDRDNSVVNSLVKEEGSGILIVGLYHLDSIANLLEATCRKTPLSVSRSASTMGVRD